MFVRRGFLAAALAASFLSLSSVGAHAGGRSIVTGMILSTDDETMRCTVVNATNRSITNVVLNIRRGDGTIRLTGCNTNLSPLRGCSTGVSGDAEFLFCEVTSDQGGKGLRATLVNDATGASSDAR